MLEVRIHHHDRLAARGREPREQRGLVPEIPRQPHAAHADVHGCERLDRGPSPVTTAVVDDHELPAVGIDGGAEHLAQVRVQDRKIAFLVIRWYHDRNHGVRRFAPQ